jgi:D-glycero-D-manno-heptose 1,7-bisphosphate phosphatase
MTINKKNKAVLLDRDGTLIHDRPGHYLTCPDKLKFYKDTPKALQILQKLGYKLFVVSNQSAIGRGYATKKTVLKINKRMTDTLKKRKINISGVYFCPHSPEDNCNCRKPKPLLGKKIIKKFNIDPKKSYMVGDKKSDMDFGRNLGLKTAILMTGHGKSQLKKFKNQIKADYNTKNILSLAKRIEKNEI